MEKLMRNFLERYNRRGLSGVYDLRDQLKLKHKDSLYCALVDDITRHFEEVVERCGFGERFSSIEDKVIGKLKCGKVNKERKI